MIRISNFRNEIAIILIVVMYLLGLIVVIVELKNFGSTPLFAYLISSIVFFLLIYFLRSSTKTIYIDYSKNLLLVKNTFSERELIKLSKDELKECSFEKLYPIQLKIVTKKDTVYYSYVKFRYKKRISNWMNL
jgi:HJR/Mrr/RecB family endonuclease